MKSNLTEDEKYEIANTLGSSSEVSKRKGVSAKQITTWRQQFGIESNGVKIRTFWQWVQDRQSSPR